jgi:hypothetical protein
MIDLRKVLEIARVNLIRQVRDRSDLFFVFVLPTIIIIALGLQFGGSSRARLGVVAPAGDLAAAALVAELGRDAILDVRAVDDAASLRTRVERGQLEAGLVIPDGYQGALSGSGTVRIEFVGTTAALTRGVRAPVEAAVSRVAAETTAIALHARTRVKRRDGRGRGMRSLISRIHRQPQGRRPGFGRGEVGFSHMRFGQQARQRTAQATRAGEVGRAQMMAEVRENEGVPLTYGLRRQIRHGDAALRTGVERHGCKSGDCRRDVIPDQFLRVAAFQPVRAVPYSRTRGKKHLPCMLLCLLRQRHPAQHAGDLFQTLLPGEERNGCVRPLTGDPFHHPVMAVAAAGDLRQMGDAEDLMVSCDFP